MGGLKMEKIILKGRKAIPGVVEGEALVCPESIQGWAGVDDRTGVIIEKGHSQEGQNIKGKILFVPYSKGSNGWSCHFHSAKRAGFCPAGFVVSKMDSRAGVAAVVLDVPCVADFEDGDPCDVVKTGDWVKVDGDNGIIEVTRK
jgi:predicted aconitase with swiveling domain